MSFCGVVKNCACGAVLECVCVYACGAVLECVCVYACGAALECVCLYSSAVVMECVCVYVYCGQEVSVCVYLCSVGGVLMSLVFLSNHEYNSDLTKNTKIYGTYSVLLVITIQNSQRYLGN